MRVTASKLMPMTKSTLLASWSHPLSSRSCRARDGSCLSTRSARGHQLRLRAPRSRGSMHFNLRLMGMVSPMSREGLFILATSAFPISMQLKCFRSLWGSPSARALGAASPAAFGERLASRLGLQGFDGLEASLADLESLGGVRHVRSVLQERGLALVAGVYSGWVDYEDAALQQQFEGVETQVERLHRQLEAALEADPAVVNVHAGSDRWSRAQQLEFLARALELGQRLGCDDKLAFETHRGRIFYSPWPTLELLEALPSLQLTLDFSHWVLVAERLLDTPEDQRWLLEKVVPHVRHVHGRVGSVQRAQLEHPEDEELSGTESERFQRLWNDVWREQMREFQADKAAGGTPRPFATFTPEYGPIPYAPRLQADTSVEAYDVDALCAAKAEKQRQIFASLRS